MATINDDYAVIVSDGTCSDTSACTTISHVGLAEFKAYDLNIYPNPVLSLLHLNLDNLEEVIEISLTDIDGKVVLK